MELVLLARSGGHCELSLSEVAFLLYCLGELLGGLVLAESSSPGACSLGSQVIRSVFAFLVGVSGGSDSLLVDHGQHLGDGLAHKLFSQL